MNRKIFLGFLMAWSVSLGACAQTESWNGLYEYEALLGENVAEDQIIIDYTLTLTKNLCKITVQGYQTDEVILCMSKEQDDELQITFKAYEDGSTENVYGVAVYAPQSLLFRLAKSNSELLTTWDALAPDENHKSGKYFRKSN